MCISFSEVRLLYAEIEIYDSDIRDGVRCDLFHLACHGVFIAKVVGAI